MSKYVIFKVRPAYKGAVFPLDMLRYDSCWPSQQEDVERIHQALAPNTPDKLEVGEIALEKHRGPLPTAGRWSSFGWEVVKND